MCDTRPTRTQTKSPPEITVSELFDYQTFITGLFEASPVVRSTLAFYSTLIKAEKKTRSHLMRARVVKREYEYVYVYTQAHTERASVGDSESRVNSTQRGSVRDSALPPETGSSAGARDSRRPCVFLTALSRARRGWRVFHRANKSGARGALDERLA